MKTNTPSPENMKRYGTPSLGCYCDGANGQDYNDRKAIRIALSYGWESSDASAALLAIEDDGDLPLTEDEKDTLREEFQGLTQDAEDYLNSLETRPFVSWYWNDGDFGLYANVESALEEVEFKSTKRTEYPPADYVGEWCHISDHGNVTLYVRGEDGKDVEVWGVV